MITRQESYLDFLSAPNTQMAIPVFQRVYTWGVWQCDELFEDIMHAGKSGENHFLGSIVYTRDDVGGGDGEECAGTTRQLFNIVDGQQRTTTTVLLLIALRDYLAKNGKQMFDYSAEDIEKKFLYIEKDCIEKDCIEKDCIEKDCGARTQKFIAAPADKATLEALLNKTSMPEQYLVSKCVVDNYNFFAEKLPKIDINTMWQGLQNLFAIVVELGEGDNPQLIFEGINSKGMSLATSDLLRNRMFFEQDNATQERLLTQYWEPLEVLFDDDPTQKHFNAAIRRWLVDRDPDLADRTRWELYSVFRKYIDEQYKGTTEQLMQELLKSCTEFKHMIKSPPMRKHLDWAEGHTEYNGASGHTMFG